MMRQLMWRSIWRNNPATVQLLGLCPMLAVSNTVINAVGLAAATTAALLMLSVCVSASRRWVAQEVRLPFYVIVLATAVTLTDLLMAAYAFELHQRLGIFIPLIVTNCALLGRAEAFASKHGPWSAAVDAIATGLGFTIALVSLGALREVLALGTLLSGADTLFAGGERWLIQVHSDEGGLLALLPPGAFFGLALLAACTNLRRDRWPAGGGRPMDAKAVDTRPTDAMGNSGRE
ncbi:MAG: RnfABCDGE type electron transport complex subunit E [Gammaproteobacteria bacterium]|nr:RnfABCDGE type electron transport complex subunit E [Gammaproteobacteria bacterium]